ncbi:hypothetical protein [Variovorax sp. 770b2]|uniref:hypothetical protein n=1 Tax=Variovorax sp. 770b2 TaxID=1566271 RepID=UPI0011606E82|nr:hypothetical protein [Variovorax sp. 770b2]
MNDFRKIGEALFLGFLGLLLSGCASTAHRLTVEKTKPSKIQTTEELLAALSNGFNEGVLGEYDFYRRKIGYEFSRFPKDKNDPKEFSYETGEAIRMNEGGFDGLLVVLEKRNTDQGKRVLSISFPTPGCLRQWEVEKIFMRLFQYSPETVLFGVRPADWPHKYQVSMEKKNTKQSITLYIGEKSHCLQNVEVTEVYN